MLSNSSAVALGSYAHIDAELAMDPVHGEGKGASMNRAIAAMGQVSSVSSKEIDCAVGGPVDVVPHVARHSYLFDLAKLLSHASEIASNDFVESRRGGGETCEVVRRKQHENLLLELGRQSAHLRGKSIHRASLCGCQNSLVAWLCDGYSEAVEVEVRRQRCKDTRVIDSLIYVGVCD